VHVVRHWGCPFLIRTDHFSLKFLLDKKLTMVPQHQWASKLLGFDFIVSYKSGAMNVVVDALSHCDTEEDATICALSAPTFCLFDDLH
jgi:hypothetical protein